MLETSQKVVLNKLAVLKYYDSGFHVLSSGDHVICAVSRKQIPVDDLKYWSEKFQEAYASSELAFQKFLQNTD